MDNDPYFIRFDDLLLKGTDIPRTQATLLARNLTILLHTYQAEKHRASFNPVDLALISCRATNKVKWLIALVESKGAETEVLIKGDPHSTRDGAVDGFRTRVEYLLWMRVGKEDAGWIT